MDRLVLQAASMDPASDAAKLSEHSKASLVAGVCETHALQYWYGDIQSRGEENLSRRDGKGRTPYLNAAEVVLSMNPASKQTNIAETWIVSLSRAGKPARCWLLISDTRPYLEYRFCETCELKYAKDLKEATYPRQRAVILRRVLDWAAMALMFLQNIEYTCQANSLWSRKNVEFGWTRGSHGFTALSNPENPDLQQQRTFGVSKKVYFVVAHNRYC